MGTRGVVPLPPLQSGVHVLTSKVLSKGHCSMIQRRSRNCVALGFVEEHVDVLQELQSPHGVNPSKSLFIEHYTF